MRLLILMVVPALALAGCSDISSVQEVAHPAPPRSVDPPMMVRSTKLGLFPNLEKPDNGELFVGDGTSQVGNLFPAPGRAFMFQELPPGFGQPYSAYGFTTNDGTSFGVIYYDNRVALAMQTIEQQTEQQIDADHGIEKVYEDEVGKPIAEIPGTKSHYWFWEDAEAKQRLMICAVQSGKDKSKFDVTIGVGDQVPMDALRMNPKDAAKDRLALEPAAPPTRIYPN